MSTEQLLSFDTATYGGRRIAPLFGTGACLAGALQAIVASAAVARRYP